MIKKILLSISLLGYVVQFNCEGSETMQKISINPKEFKEMEFCVLKSREEAETFAIYLSNATEDEINVDNKKKINYSLETILQNTIIAQCDTFDGDYSKLSEESKALLSSMLLTINHWVSSVSLDSSLYCLNLWNKFADNDFARAKLLLSSQCEKHFSPRKDACWNLIGEAILMLQNEKNGHAKKAEKLLGKLKNIATHPFEAILGK